jgi:hypothetical protein
MKNDPVNLGIFKNQFSQLWIETYTFCQDMSNLTFRKESSVPQENFLFHPHLTLPPTKSDDETISKVEDYELKIRIKRQSHF